MSRVRADFKKRSHPPDKLRVIANYRAAPDIFFRIDAQISFRLAERREVVKFDLSPLNRERLRFHSESTSPSKAISDRERKHRANAWPALPRRSGPCPPRSSGSRWHA